jgi:hypothetical protein
MNDDLQLLLPQILPKAIQWAQRKSAEIQSVGLPLSETELKLAKLMGVNEPQRIRILLVRELPLPEDPELSAVALSTGLIGPNMVGLTLGHGIFICEGHRTNRLVSHECRHVYQYEQAGSIHEFLPIYLLQIAQFGYEGAPYEHDAYAHEVDA